MHVKKIMRILEHNKQRRATLTTTTSHNKSDNEAEDGDADAAAAAVAAAADAANCAATAGREQAEPEFQRLIETRKSIYRAIASLHDGSFGKRISRLLKQYESAVREEFEGAKQSPLMCRKLARILSGFTELIHTIARSLLQTAESRARLCDIVAHYIACELGAAQEPSEPPMSVLSRIGSALRLHVEVADEAHSKHKEHVLRCLCAIPKLYNATDIMKGLYRRLLPQWNAASGAVEQQELPDKLYIQYIILFYNWRHMELEEATRERLLDFADKFMRPARSLANNSVYAEYLPKYQARHTATSHILFHLNSHQHHRLRITSRLDNRLLQTDKVVYVSSDEEEQQQEQHERSSALLLVSALDGSASPVAEPDADFLRQLLENARKSEPCKRAEALFSGIDATQEIIELRDSDDDVEMFSVDFNVPASVDAQTSSNEAASCSQTPPPAVETMDDYVPITRIFPSNLRTYERAGSNGQSQRSQVPNYTLPRIVSSYSCRRDSLAHRSQPRLVDQSVQTAETETDPISTCVLYSDTMLQQQQSTSAAASATSNSNSLSTQVLYSSPFGIGSQSQSSQKQSSQSHSQSYAPYNGSHSHSHSHSGSGSLDSSETSLHKKQVTFSAQHLGAHEERQLWPASASASVSASTSTSLSSRLTSASSIRPVIKSYRAEASRFVERIESLKSLGRQEHLEAGDRMFAKNETIINCDKEAATTTRSNSLRRPSAKTGDNVRTSLTPTMSNKSSKGSSYSTPTKRMREEDQQEQPMLTPPASSHSSGGRAQRHNSTDTISSIDMEQLQRTAKQYNFNRRNFSKIGKEHVGFYNELISVQRRSLRQRRQQRLAEQEIQQQESQPQQREREEEDQLAAGDGQQAVEQQRLLSVERRRLKEAERHRNHLRQINEKLRQDAEQMDRQLEAIKTYTATQQQLPVVRLKRVKLKEYAAQATTTTTTTTTPWQEIKESSVAELSEEREQKEEQRQQGVEEQHAKKKQQWQQLLTHKETPKGNKNIKIAMEAAAQIEQRKHRKKGRPRKRRNLRNDKQIQSQKCEQELPEEEQQLEVEQPLPVKISLQRACKDVQREDSALAVTIELQAPVDIESLAAVTVSPAANRTTTRATTISGAATTAVIMKAVGTVSRNRPRRKTASYRSTVEFREDEEQPTNVESSTPIPTTSTVYPAAIRTTATATTVSGAATTAVIMKAVGTVSRNRPRRKTASYRSSVEYREDEEQPTNVESSTPIPTTSTPPIVELVAAYVTLTASGECCDETQTSLPEMETSAAAASAAAAAARLDLELATCNVPVYLLNGESRDVPTPGTGTPSSPPTPAPLDLSKDLRRLAIANWMELQRRQAAAERATASAPPMLLRRQSSATHDCSSGGTRKAAKRPQQRRRTFNGRAADRGYVDLLLPVTAYKPCKFNAGSGGEGDYLDERQVELEYVLPPLRLAYVEALPMMAKGGAQKRLRRKLNS